MKLLFVDDNEFNRVVLNDMIEMLFKSVSLETYERADDLLKLDLSSYHLILSDIDMPDIDGFELHDILREKHNFTKPIIAVTALAISGDREKILMHGFDDYISKPIDMDELKRVLQKYI